MLSELVEPEQPNLIRFKKDEIQESCILLLRKYVAYQILYYLHIKQFICKAMCIYHVKYVFYCISELVWASTNLLRQVSEIWIRLKPTTSWFVNEYSTIWPNWGFRQNGWVFIYELGGYRFNSDSSYLKKFSKASSPYGLRNCFSTYSLNQDRMFVLKPYFQ